MKNVGDKHKQPTSDRIIVMTENKRAIRFNNSRKLDYIKVHVDGSAVSSGIRCDYLLTSKDETEEHFVELKGTDVGHAIEQLEATIMALGEYKDNRHSYVVSTNVAPALNTSIQKAKLSFMKKHGSTLDIKEKVIAVKLS